MILPVTQAEAGEARYSAAAAMSSGTPRHLRGVLLSMVVRMASGITLARASVRIGPGDTALTRICGANSWASKRVRCVSAALAEP
ncbi:hypothetical protein D3C80_1558770 [compost metagenome]